MKYKIKKELKKIELLVKYANSLVGSKGVKEQLRLGNLDYKNNDSYFNCLLYVEHLCTDFSGVSGVNFKARRLLYKRINNNLEYITLLDAVDGDDLPSEYQWYELKCDIDACSSLQRLKREARSMINNPDDYYRTTNV